LHEEASTHRHLGVPAASLLHEDRTGFGPRRLQASKQQLQGLGWVRVTRSGFRVGLFEFGARHAFGRSGFEIGGTLVPLGIDVTGLATLPKRSNDMGCAPARAYIRQTLPGFALELGYRLPLFGLRHIERTDPNTNKTKDDYHFYDGFPGQAYVGLGVWAVVHMTCAPACGHDPPTIRRALGPGRRRRYLSGNAVESASAL